MARALSLLFVIVLIVTATIVIRPLWLWGISSSATGGELAMMSHGCGHACGQCLYGTFIVLIQENDVLMH